MYCAGCGTQLAERQQFCVKCGARSTAAASGHRTSELRHFLREIGISLAAMSEAMSIK